MKRLHLLAWLTAAAPVAAGAVSLSALSSACASPEAPADGDPVETTESAAGTCDVHAERSLVIVDRQVLGTPALVAPGGTFDFAAVVDKLTPPGVDARRTITDAFASRTVRNAWPLTPMGELDLTRAPFRLVAVVLRPEMTWQSVGELRLVFEAYAGGALGELVSFEYGIDWRRAPPGTLASEAAPANIAEATARRKAWLDAWRALEQKPFATPAYVAALASLTEAVIRPTNAGGTRKAPLLRVVGIETRENAATWQFTALALGSNGLAKTSLAGTPPASWNDPGFVWNAPSAGWGGGCGGWAGGPCSITDPLTTLIAQREASLYSGSFVLPTEISTSTMPGTKASAWGTELPAPAGWTEPRWSRARELFSRETCDGCHGADTATDIHHIAPQPSGPAKLSAFVRDQELPVRKVAYRVAMCGASALTAVTTLTPSDGGSGGGIEIATPCTTAGEVFAEACGRGGTRYAVCVSAKGKLVVSDRTTCIEAGALECTPGETRETPGPRCSVRRDTCSDYRWFTGVTTGSPVNACEPGATDRTTAGCATPGTFRVRTCQPTCGWGAYSATCTP